MLNVLIACEESQRVCIEMRKLGHRAFSCDILECSGGHPEWHIQGDVLPLLNGDCAFQTMDGQTHTQDGKWDLIIAFPPCTKLSNAGCVNLGRKDSICQTQEWREKFFADRTDAAIFFMTFLAADCERIAVENPVGFMNTHYKPPTQFIEPYMFGDPWKKKTGLWLKGLKKLTPTNEVMPTGKWVQQNKKIDCLNPKRGKLLALETQKFVPKPSPESPVLWLNNGRPTSRMGYRKRNKSVCLRRTHETINHNHAPRQRLCPVRGRRLY